MFRYLLCLCTLLPLFALGQTVDDWYLEQKLEEAGKYQRRFDYTRSLQVLDSLQVLSRQEHNDFAAAMALTRKIHYGIINGNYTGKEPDWAAVERYKAPTKIRQNTLKLQVLKLKAAWYQSTGKNYPEAFRLLREGIRLAESGPEYQALLAGLWYLSGQLNAKNSDYVAANDCFLKSLRIYNSLNDEISAGQLYSELANTSFLMGEKERAIDYSRKGIAAMEQQEDYEELTVQLSNLARMYQLGGQIDSAIKYFDRSASYASRSAKQETKFISLVDLALVYHAKKDRPNALKYMEAAIAQGRKTGQPKLHRYIRLGAMFAGYTGDEPLMDRYYEESYQLALQDQDRDALRDWHGSKNFYYAQLKQDRATAYPYLEKFHAYKDSIINEKSRKDFNELEVQYQSEKKQAEIERLAIEQRIQQLEIEKKNALLRGNLVEAARKQKELQLLTQEHTISTMKIEQQAKAISLAEVALQNLEQQKKIAVQDGLIKEEKLRNEQLKRNLIIILLCVAVLLFIFILNRITLKRKLEQKNLLLQERSRIATELHDEVGSTLTAINLLSYTTANELHEPGPKKQVEKIMANTQSVMENIGDIVWSMNPDNDSFRQIAIRMKGFAADVLEPQNISYQFRLDDRLEQVKLSPAPRRDLYLIFKEALNNLAKYAQAKTVTIEINKQAQQVRMMIKDDGTGFNANLVQRGNGLKNMRSRAEKNKGSFDLNAGAGGTIITVYFPYA